MEESLGDKNKLAPSSSSICISLTVCGSVDVIWVGMKVYDVILASGLGWRLLFHFWRFGELFSHCSQLYWGITGKQKLYILRCTTSFGKCIHCEMIITIKLVNIFITLQSYLFCCWFVWCKHLRSTILANSYTIQYCWASLPGCTLDLQNQCISYNWNFESDWHLPFLPPCSPWQPQFCSVLSMSLTLLDVT